MPNGKGKGRMQYPHDQIEQTGSALSGHADSLHSVASSASGNSMGSQSLGSLGSGTANTIHGHLQQLPNQISQMAITEDENGQRLRRNSIDMRSTDEEHASTFQGIQSQLHTPTSTVQPQASSSKRPRDEDDDENDQPADVRPFKRPVRPGRFTGNYNEGGSGGGGGLPSNHPDFPRKSYGTWTSNTTNTLPTGNVKGDEANWNDKRHIIPYNHMASTMQKWVDHHYPKGNGAQADQDRRNKISELGGVLKDSNNNVNNLWVGRGDENQAIGGISTNLHHNQQSIANANLTGQDAYDKANRWNAAGSHLRPSMQGDLTAPYMKPLTDDPALSSNSAATNHYLNDVHDSAHFDWPEQTGGNASQNFGNWEESYHQMSRIQNNPQDYTEDQVRWTFDRFNNLPKPQ